MPRLNPIDPTRAEGKAKKLLEGVHKTLGMTPNLMRTMANSPAVLDAYLSFLKALSGGSLSAQTREQIALAVAGANACDYCASAHTAAGRGMGVEDGELALNLQGQSSDPKFAAALAFAHAILASEGWVSDEDIALVRAAGYDDGAVAEIVANVAANIFSNYFDHVAETEIDFPLVKADERLGA